VEGDRIPGRPAAIAITRAHHEDMKDVKGTHEENTQGFSFQERCSVLSSLKSPFFTVFLHELHVFTLAFVITAAAGLCARIFS
jgi:hypothetical protein